MNIGRNMTNSSTYGGGRGPHKIKMSPYDAEKHIWVVDDNLHQIHKFTYDGELVLTHGERGVSGRGPNNFSRPTDIAWLPDGTYFISDGYVGTRVAKFDANDNFIMDWGRAPADPANPRPNEFNTVHAISISAEGLIYVSDRAHARIQVFDENGNFQFMFPTGQRGESLPYAIEILQDPSGRGVPLGRGRQLRSNSEVRSGGEIMSMAGAPRVTITGTSTARTRSRPIRTATCTLRKCSPAGYKSSSRGPVPTLPRSWDGSGVRRGTEADQSGDVRRDKG